MVEADNLQKWMLINFFAFFSEGFRWNFKFKVKSSAASGSAKNSSSNKSKNDVYVLLIERSLPIDLFSKTYTHE